MSDFEASEIEFGGGAGFREIALTQFHTCIRHSNVEFRGGFYTHVVTKEGTEKEQYTPDTRDSYCNAIYALALVVLPRFDDKMIKRWEIYKQTKDAILDEFHEKTQNQADVVLGEVFYEDEKDKIALETLKVKNLKLHHLLLESLSQLFDRKNYFGMGAGID